MVFANILVAPLSRGTIKLASSNPFDEPLINPACLSSPLDRALILETGKLTISAMHGPIGKEYGVQEYGTDDDAGMRGSISDEAMEKRLLKTVDTICHGSGTCAMGSVVDCEGKVLGLQGLRVVDSSIFPAPTTAHYQAVVYAVAEQVKRLFVLVVCTC